MSQKSMKPMKNKPIHVVKTSSPGKVYHSRASKPSGVQPIADPSSATAEDVANKLNELLAALKK